MERKIIFRHLLLAAVLASGCLAAQEQEDVSRAAQPNNLNTLTAKANPVEQVSSQKALIIHEFAVNQKTGWPYDVKQLQSQSVAELRAKCGDKMDVMVGLPATPRQHSYTLDGEILSWHPGNRAKRMIVGMGSGRETAEIHYWLSDETGKKLFDHKDTIRAEFWGNAYAGSVGELAHPFASKISARLTEAKLF